MPGEPIHRLSVEQYHAMVQQGILGPADRVELLDGWLVPKMTKKPPHRVATRCTSAALERVVPSGWYVDTQEPIGTTDSEPEPDVTVIRGATRDYIDENPSASAVGLVVEAADASLRRDRETKGSVYARAEIPVYWIVNLSDRRLEVYTDPAPAGEPAHYRSRREHGPDESVPVVLDGVVVGHVVVRDLLP